MNAAKQIGSIQFINSLPVDLGILSAQVPCDLSMVQGVPTRLNGMLVDGSLAVSPVSAFWYAEHANDLVLLPHLSISSESSVQSVLLFSRIKMQDLAGGRIAVTRQGSSTPALLRILCQLRYGFVPNLTYFDVVPSEIPQGFDALLLIGDEALLAKERLGAQDLDIFDLALEWEKWTRLPFVFAVWAARKDYSQEENSQAVRVHEQLLESKRWGLSHPREVIAAAKKKILLSEASIQSYLEGLCYDLGDRMAEALGLYWKHAVRCGLLAEAPSVSWLKKHSEKSHPSPVS